MSAAPGMDVFAPGQVLVTDAGRELVVRNSRPYRDRGLVIGFVGIGYRSAAEELRGAILTIDPSQRPELTEGEYWADDLVGLTAVDPDGAALGTVISVDFGVEQYRVVVRTADGTSVLGAFVGDIVGDAVDGAIVIDAPEGLFG